MAKSCYKGFFFFCILPKLIKKQEIYATHLSESESSEHMASQRFSEEVFLRMPLKAFGGWGKFGKQKSLISTSLTSSTLASDCIKDSTVIPAHDSIKTIQSKSKFQR